MAAQQVSIEQWDIFEITLQGPDERDPATPNPFRDVELSARFTNGDTTLTIAGFYDGDGTYKVRFMPTRTGVWNFATQSNRNELTGQIGEFTAIDPTGGNRGPVRIHNTFHFKYADGTPYKQIGTTAYAWTHQGEFLEEQTLSTLRAGPFNKMRMCVFPKRYAFNANEPPLYPFQGMPPNQWDFDRPNPEFWRHFETRVAQLRSLGIEADLILFHPYDEGHWGFDRMSTDADDRYLRYCVARLGAFRNVWWSLANEFDFMKTKTKADWDRFIDVVAAADPYRHLLSIHNGHRIYDHNHPALTHASIQNGSAVEDFGRATIYRDVYYKPIVLDEVKYEGNIPQRWGDISAEEMVHRFWQGTIAGCYVGHGETYKHPNDVIWWARGGELHGQSPMRLKFLRHVLEKGPANGIDPIDKWQDVRTAGVPGEYYLVYFGRERPAEWLFELPRAGLSSGMQFTVEVLDTWNMMVMPVDAIFTIITDTTYRYHADGLPKIKLPVRPYVALRIERVEGDTVAYQGEEKVYGEQ